MTARRGGYAAQEPALVVEFFGPEAAHAIIYEEFSPKVGWYTVERYRKRVSRTWLLKLRRKGVTGVCLLSGDRVGDFTVAELLADRRRL